MVRRVHVLAALGLQAVMFVAGAGSGGGSLQYWLTFPGTYPLQIAAPAAWEAVAAIGVFELVPAAVWLIGTAFGVGMVHYAQAVGMAAAGERIGDVLDSRTV